MLRHQALAPQHGKQAAAACQHEITDMRSIEGRSVQVVAV
jgi:hypothetical protein